MAGVVSAWVQEDEMKDNKWLYKLVYRDKVIAYKLIRMMWRKLGLRDIY